MKKNMGPLIGILVVVILIIILYPMFATQKSASLTVSDQSLDGSQVTIDAFFLDKPGYVVIHKEADGKPGPVIGNSELVSGANRNLKVTIDETQAGTRIFAMLHYDDGDSTYEFPGPDAPVTLEDAVVVKPINLG